jgi:hypothetical protein
MSKIEPSRDERCLKSRPITRPCRAFTASRGGSSRSRSLQWRFGVKKPQTDAEVQTLLGDLSSSSFVFIIKEHESELTLWDIEFEDLVNLIDKEQGRIIVVVQYQTIESWVRANCRNHCGASEVGGGRVDKPSHEETHIATLIRDIHLDVLSSDEYSKPLHHITPSAVQRPRSAAARAR